MGCCTSCSRPEDVFYPLLYVPFDDLNFPSPRPPSCRRKKIFKPEDYVYLKKHLCKLIPEHVLYGNFNTLAHYISKPASDDIGRLWAIYQWLANLDIDVLLSNSTQRMADIYSPVEFAKKSGEDGRSHAQLFAALVRPLGIPCVVITGVTKNINYSLGGAINRGGMVAEWNAVYVNGDWRLVDTYWASHSVIGRRLSDWIVVSANGDVITVPEQCSNGTVHRRRNNFFFLTDPDMLIGTHLPDDARWQLLPEPGVIESRFASCVYLRERYYQLGCTIVPGDCTEVVLRPTDGTQRIQFDLPADRSSTFDFIYLFFKESSSCHNVQNANLRGTVFAEFKPDSLAYTVSFPFRGRYRFDVFGIDVNENDAFDLIASYVIEIDKPCLMFEMLPDSPSIGWGPGVEMDNYGLQALTHRESVIHSQEGQVEIRFLMMEELSCGIELKCGDTPSCQLDNQVLLRIDGGQLIINVRLAKKGQYAVKLYAKVGQDPGPLSNVCNYLVKHAGKAATPSSYPRVHGNWLGKRFPNCERFGVQAISHTDDIVKTLQSELLFKFSSPKSGTSLLANLSGSRADADGVLVRTTSKLYTEFKVTLPAKGEYALNVYSRSEDVAKLHPTFCYLIDYLSDEPDPDDPTELSISYITGTQVNKTHTTQSVELVSASFEQCLYASAPGDRIDASVTVSQTGVGMNFLLDVVESESYRLDIYEEDSPRSGRLLLMTAHRLIPFVYDKYDETAVAERHIKARALEAAKKESIFVAPSSAVAIPGEFNRDAFRARLKMTLAAPVLYFTEAALATCRYYEYTDDDLVPRLERQALVLNKKIELGLTIKQALGSQSIHTLERTLLSIEEAGIEKEMGFLLGVAMNILVKKISKKITDMDNRTVAEVKSYSAPPRAIQKVMKASLLLMGHKKKELEDWTTIRSIMGDTQKLMQRIKQTDVEAVNYKTVIEASRLMETLSHDEVRHTSDMIDSFYLWTKNMIKLKVSKRRSIYIGEERSDDKSVEENGSLPMKTTEEETEDESS